MKLNRVVGWIRGWCPRETLNGGHQYARQLSRLLSSKVSISILVIFLAGSVLTLLAYHPLKPIGATSSNPLWERMEVRDYFDHLVLKHPFSAEVALNRPGLHYNLSRLEQSESLIIENGVIRYKSHYNPEVAVILSRPWGFDGKCLSVGLEIPSGPLSYPIVEVNIGLTKRPERVDETLLYSLGYNGSFNSNVHEGHVYVMSKWTKGEETHINVTDVLKWTNVWTIPNKVWVLLYWEGHKEGDPLFPYPGGFRALVRNETALSRNLADEFRSILDAHGIDSSLWRLANVKSWVYEEELVHFPTVSILPKKFDWEEAMRVELEWLRDNGIIQGLTNEDVQAISSLCDLGTSGYNRRTVFWEGVWKRYNETNATLVK